MVSLAKPRITLVDGYSGAGKSEYAKGVALHNGAILLSLDDVYPGWDGLDAGSWHVHRQVLIPISQGLAGRYQRWDWAQMQPGEWVQVSPLLPLVIEGCGALRREARGIEAHRVWVDAPEDVRRRRALARDGELYAPHWGRWALQEQRFAALHGGELMADEVVPFDQSGLGVSNGA